MKLKTKCATTFCGAALLALSLEQSMALESFYFQPDTANPAVGDSFDLNLYADIGAGEKLFGWDFNVLFDPGAVGLTQWNSAPGWDAVQSLSTTGFAGLSLDGMSGNDILIGEFSFKRLGAGTSGIDLAYPDLLQGFLVQYGDDPANQGLLAPTISATLGQGDSSWDAPDTGLGTFGLLLISGTLLWFSHRKSSAPKPLYARS